MKKLVVAGNWKMNTDLQSGLELAGALAEKVQKGGPTVIIAPPFPFLSAIQNQYAGQEVGYALAAQNCHQEASGAYTGEVSAGMLASMNIPYVIIGHSERRQYFAESSELLAKKVDQALEQGLKPIFCCGEPLPVREEGSHVPFVNQQLSESLFHLRPEQMQELMIAYEPIWAIGTGVTASPEQAQEMHAAIRQLLEKQFGAAIAIHTPILYGGSVKPANAEDLFGKADVDGGLVGGASLKSDSFLSIIEIAENLMQ